MPNTRENTPIEGGCAKAGSEVMAWIVSQGVVLGYHEWFMSGRAVLVLALLSVCGCQRAPEENRAQAVVGAVLLDGTGGPPLTDSAVVATGTRITAAGRRTETPIPPDANVVDGSGKFVIPALVDAASAQLGRVSTLPEARALVSEGASGFIGMIRDTEDIDPAFVSQLRDLKIVVVPALSAAGVALPVAERNTRRLFAAGVPIALASGAGGPVREAELLVEAGIPPLDVIVAATRNAAMTLGQLADRGTLQTGKRANLLLLSANPGVDIRSLEKVARRMEDGAWK
jgi:imidazolonepropionase-like amidohydrolase